MKLEVAQVLGLNTDQNAAQTISQIRDFDNTFFALLHLTSDDAFTKGRLALSELADFYFEAEGTPSEKIKATYQESLKKFEGLDFDILIAVISGKVLYFIGKDNVEVLLKRGDQISSLFKVGVPSQLVSGFLQMGDRVFFASKNLTTYISDNLDKFLNLKIDVFEQDLTEEIASALESGGMAGLLIVVESGEQQEVIESLGQKKEETLENEKIFRETKATKYLEKILFFISRIGLFLPKGGRGRIILGIILLILILSGIGFRFKSVSDETKNAFFSQTLQQARDELEAAKGLASLDPSQAKTRLDSAKEKVEKALALKPEDSGARSLKTQIEEGSGSILQKSFISEFPLFLDLNLIKENFNTKYLSLSQGKILALDPSLKTLILIDIESKKSEILAGSQQLGEATLASLNGNLAFIFSKDKGILRLDTKTQKITEVSSSDEDFGEITDLYGFASNIYLLDTLSSKIWKYLPVQNGYSSKREYLTVSGKADFAGSLRMQIESSIFILKRNGEMLRFTRGEKDHFSYDGLDRGVKDPKSFFVSSDTEDLYILDSGNLRLLILTKTGSYKGQMEGEKFSQASDLVVDEKEKKVYLLEGSKIYQVDLK